MITKKLSLSLSLLLISTTIQANSANYTVQEYWPYSNIGMIILWRETVVDNGFQFSPDGSGFSYVVSNTNFRKVRSLAEMKYTVVENGVEKSQYDNSYYRTYAPIGNSFSYVAKKDGKEFIVKDGVEWEKYDEIKSFPIYSLNGESLTYIAKRDDKEFIVKDGVEWEKYDEVKSMLTYSPDGKSFAYLASKDYKDILIKDGVEIGTYDSYWIRGMLYSTDSKEFIYIAKDNDGKEHIIREWKKGKWYESISFPLFSPDGKDFIYKAFNITDTGGYQSFIVKNEVEWSIYRDIYRIGYSPDGKYFFFLWSTIDNRNVLVINGEEYENYSNWPSPIFSSGGTSYAFIMKKDDKATVIKDDEEVWKYDYVTGLQYAPEWDSLTYMAERDGKKMQIGTDNETQEDSIRVYSSDGKSSTIVEKSGTWFVVKKDGEELGTFNLVSKVIYSPDNKKLAIIAWNEEWSSILLYTFNNTKSPVAGNTKDLWNDWKPVSEEPKIENSQTTSPAGTNAVSNSGNSLLYIFWWSLLIIILSAWVYIVMRKRRLQNNENIMGTPVNDQLVQPVDTVLNNQIH